MVSKNLIVLFDDYINECKYAACLRPETVRGYSNVFKRFLKEMPEVTDVKSLTEEMLNEFFKRVQSRPRKAAKEIKIGVKKSTIKTYWTKLNVFFDWLKGKNHTEENPLKNIKPPKVQYDDFKRLEDHEINKIYSSIVANCGGLMFRRDTLMISLLLYTGIRKGEFISLQLKDLDLEKRIITIRGETSKSKFTRCLKIHSTLLMHIRDYLAERNRLGYKTEYLFVSTKSDRKLSVEGLKHWVEKIKKISGVKFHLHQFRHTFACKLVEANVNLFKIQKLMGHSSINMTTKYLRSLKTENMEIDIEKISI